MRHLHDMPRVGVIGVLCGALLVATSCGAEIAEGEANIENAIAAYVWLADDPFDADELFDPVTKAVDGEPRSPAGFTRGLRSASAVTDRSRGGFGLQLVFQSDSSGEDRAVLERKVAALGLSVVWLGHADECPYCVGIDDCFRVGDTPSLP